MSTELPLLRDGVVRGACPHDCPDTCAMLVHVEDGRAVRVQGDPAHPVTQGFLCTKVNRYVERTYHADRLRTPLRRVGRKGEGRFEPATWDEALGDIARRLRGVIETHGRESVLPYSYAGTMGLVQGGSMDRRFFHRLGASLLARTICSAAGTEGWRHTYGARLGPSPEEAEHARLVLLWGTNTLTSNPHLWPALLRARERGARIVAIDPIRTRTAAQCDAHLAPLPGTDAALALGMMHVILRDGLEDRDYLERFTHGREKLPGRVAGWTPERTARVTGLDAADIEALAREYALTRPSFIRLNYGMQRHSGGGMAVRVLSLLPAVTGAWRDVGGGATISTSGAFEGLDRAALQRPDWIPPGTRTINMIRLGDALTRPDAGVGGPAVHALVVYNSNPAAVAPELGRVREGLRREDLFTVVLEHFQTDTADYADWVLPATTQLEHWDLHTSYGHHFLTLNRPAIAPVGESLPNSEIFRRLAARMGLDDPAFRDSDLDLIAQALRSDDPRLEGITLERLLAEGYARLNIPQPFAPHAEPHRLGTPTGRIQIEAPEMERLGLDPLPAYTPPAELPEEEETADFPLMLVSPPEHWFLNSTFVNVPALRRSAGEVRLLIHPDDAAARGIESGDRVRIHNRRGEFTAPAEVTEAVRPGVAASYGVRWVRLSEDGHTVNDTTSQRETDMGGGPVFYDNAVEVERVVDVLERPSRRARGQAAEVAAGTAGSPPSGTAHPSPAPDPQHGGTPDLLPIAEGGAPLAAG
ncbi:MAG TPA: molybdopterin oxidoreductase family protein [Longimicrobiaceae bacterium]|nr:molybdopterin oxidoreductase family protein [Longimicrobiaceae bacterium]